MVDAKPSNYLRHYKSISVTISRPHHLMHALEPTLDYFASLTVNITLLEPLLAEKTQLIFLLIGISAHGAHSPASIAERWYLMSQFLIKHQAPNIPFRHGAGDNLYGCIIYWSFDDSIFDIPMSHFVPAIPAQWRYWRWSTHTTRP